MLNGKDTAFHDDDAHIQTHVLHRDRLTLEGLAVNGSVIHGSGFFLGRTAAVCGKAGNHRSAHGVHGFKKGLALQVLSGFDDDFHLYAKLILELSAYRRYTLLDHIFTVGHKADM